MERVGVNIAQNHLFSPYEVISGHCPDLTICAIFTQNMYSSIETITCTFCIYGDIALQRI